MPVAAFRLIRPGTPGEVVKQLMENIGYWRPAVPDLSIDLYDEVSQKEPQTPTAARRDT